jgi:hypothetical protein
LHGCTLTEYWVTTQAQSLQQANRPPAPTLKFKLAFKRCGSVTLLNAT